jgi:hypothetical protein
MGGIGKHRVSGLRPDLALYEPQEKHREFCSITVIQRFPRRVSRKARRHLLHAEDRKK